MAEPLQNITETAFPGTGRMRFTVLLLALSAIVFFSLAGACAFGPVRIDFMDCCKIVLSALGGQPLIESAQTVFPDGSVRIMGYEALRQTIIDLRLPRVLLAFGTGSCLAVSGVVFQGILRNPLADPFTLGVSSGAACGAAVAISFGLGVFASGFGIAASAFAGAVGALGVVLFLGGMRSGLRRETLVLAGVIVSAFLAALISLVKALDESSVTGIVFWIMGSFQGRTWTECALVLPGILAGIPLVFLLHRELDMLHLGDRAAAYLGLRVARCRLLLLVVSSAMTAACVAVSGIIGFIGLVVPHLCRLFVGAEHRFLLPLSMLLGGLLLLWSDVAARSLLPGGVELPVGVITALLGGPFFCYLLYRQGTAPQPRHKALLSLSGNMAGMASKEASVLRAPVPAWAEQGQTCLHASGVRVCYGPDLPDAVTGAGFNLFGGECIGLLGPNGSGKSSLLRCLSGVQHPQAGVVHVGGRDIAAIPPKERARLLATLPQRVENVPAVPVFSLALMGRYPYTAFLGEYSEEDRRVTYAALRETGVAHLVDRPADTLSGGELQRVLLARCLAQETPLLLLDEATTGLDPTYQTGVFSVLRSRRLERCITVVAAMHDLNLAALYCDRIIIMNRGQIVADGPVEQVFVPQILEQVYETPLDFVTHPQTGRPQVVFLAA